MDVREKLVELLSYFADGYSVENRHIVGGQKVCEIADYLIAHGVTVQEWKPISEPPKETGHYLVNIHQEDAEKGEFVDFVLDAWYQVTGLLFVPDTVGWSLLNEWHDLTAQMLPFVTHWTERPQPPKGE